MSFTVMRYKDGKPITPLKLSIWDAFKGVPSPKPKQSKPCPCCRQLHSTHHHTNILFGRKLERGNRNLNNSNAESPENQVTPKTDARTTGHGTRSTKPIETYNDEDNIKIIEMKNAQKSWRDILAALGKESLQQLKEHWKTIDPKNASANANANANDNAGSSGQITAPLETEEQKAAEIAEKKSKGRARKQAEREGQKQEPTGPAEQAQLTDPAGHIKPSVDRDDRHKWMAAASKHFDLTGERISAATARMMAEQK